MSPCELSDSVCEDVLRREAPPRTQGSPLPRVNEVDGEGQSFNVLLFVRPINRGMSVKNRRTGPYNLAEPRPARERFTVFKSLQEQCPTGPF